MCSSMWVHIMCFVCLCISAVAHFATHATIQNEPRSTPAKCATPFSHTHRRSGCTSTCKQSTRLSFHSLRHAHRRICIYSWKYTAFLIASAARKHTHKYLCPGAVWYHRLSATILHTPCIMQMINQIFALFPGADGFAGCARVAFWHCSQFCVCPCLCMHTCVRCLAADTQCNPNTQSSSSSNASACLLYLLLPHLPSHIIYV